MPRARKHLVCLSDTPYYHVSSRCVRRAFLCGVDKETGNSYEHRREWIENRVRVLSSIFCIDLCAYAVMSNHYHLVVKLNPDLASEWSDEDVLDRWTTLFRGPLLVQQFQSGQSLASVETESLDSMTAVFRERLTSLSWFMKCLNEPIARMANHEDHCSGHFWEARFHSDPLCSEQAIIAAMAYVDLNPIRARIASTPEQSEFTSIKARLQSDNRHNDLKAAISRMLKRGEINHFNVSIRPLKEFSETRENASVGNKTNDGLPIYALEYLKLVDTTGRVLRRGKRGRIDPNLEPILTRLNLSADQWINVSSSFRQYYRSGYLRLRRAA